MKSRNYKRSEVIRLAASLPQREVARRLGIGVATVNRILVSAGKKSVMSSGSAIARRRQVEQAPSVEQPIAPPAPAPVPPVVSAEDADALDPRWLGRLWTTAYESGGAPTIVLSCATRASPILERLVREAPAPIDDGGTRDRHADTAAARARLDGIIASALDPDAPPPPSPAHAPSSPEAVPADALVDEINRWVTLCEFAAAKAEADGVIGALTGLLSRGAALEALRKRATPPAPASPNDDPVYAALAKQFEEKLLQQIRGIFDEPSEPSAAYAPPSSDDAAAMTSSPPPPSPSAVAPPPPPPPPAPKQNPFAPPPAPAVPLGAWRGGSFFGSGGGGGRRGF